MENENMKADLRILLAIGVLLTGGFLAGCGGPGGATTQTEEDVKQAETANDAAYKAAETAGEKPK